MVLLSCRCLSFLVAATLLAQAPVAITAGDGRAVVSLHDAAAEAAGTSTLQVPVLGYLASDSPVRVRPIIGAPGAVVLGDAIPLPRNVTRLIPVPGQQFGLVELSRASQLGLIQLGSTTSGPVQPLPNTIAHPDRVVFSPGGAAIVLIRCFTYRFDFTRLFDPT